MNKLQIKNLINKENPTIFEIGAADGQDSVDFINSFGEINLYSFEPDPSNIKLIKEKISYEKFNLFEGVISNLDDEITFNRSRTDNPDDLRYSGSIKLPKEHLNEWNWIYFDEQIKVKSIKLDTFCEQNNINIIDFIWADVQGAEDLMIIGGIETFKNKVRFLYTEYANKEYYENQPNLNKILSLLGNDWELVHDFGSDILLKNKNL